MNRNLTRFGIPTVLVAAAALMFFAPAAVFADDEAAAATAAVGSPAPAFTLTDEAGNEHSLEQYRGKTVVLEWTNPECPFVVRHYEERTFHTMIEGLDSGEVVWLAIDSSNFITPERSIADKERFGHTVPFLQDPSGDVGRAYGARTTPHMYVIDTEGVLQYVGAIDDDPRGRNDASERTNYVAGALAALAAGNTPDPSSTQPYGCSVKYEGVN